MKYIKVLVFVGFISFMIYLLVDYFNRVRFRNSYINALASKSAKYVDSVYEMNVIGVITYINNFGDEEYVISLKDSTGKEFTFGKIKIEGFSHFKLGDSIEKVKSSFTLRSLCIDSTFVATMKF